MEKSKNTTIPVSWGVIEPKEKTVESPFLRSSSPFCEKEATYTDNLSSQQKKVSLSRFEYDGKPVYEVTLSDSETTTRWIPLNKKVAETKYNDVIKSLESYGWKCVGGTFGFDKELVAPDPSQAYDIMTTPTDSKRDLNLPPKVCASLTEEELQAFEHAIALPRGAIKALIRTSKCLDGSSTSLFGSFRIYRAWILGEILKRNTLPANLASVIPETIRILLWNGVMGLHEDWTFIKREKTVMPLLNKLVSGKSVPISFIDNFIGAAQKEALETMRAKNVGLDGQRRGRAKLVRKVE